MWESESCREHQSKRRISVIADSSRLAAGGRLIQREDVEGLVASEVPTGDNAANSELFHRFGCGHAVPPFCTDGRRISPTVYAKEYACAAEQQSSKPQQWEIISRVNFPV